MERCEGMEHEGCRSVFNALKALWTGTGPQIISF